MDLWVSSGRATAAHLCLLYDSCSVSLDHYCIILFWLPADQQHPKMFIQVHLGAFNNCQFSLLLCWFPHASAASCCKSLHLHNLPLMWLKHWYLLADLLRTWWELCQIADSFPQFLDVSLAEVLLVKVEPNKLEKNVSVLSGCNPRQVLIIVFWCWKIQFVTIFTGLDKPTIFYKVFLNLNETTTHFSSKQAFISLNSSSFLEQHPPWTLSSFICNTCSSDVALFPSSSVG